MADTFEVRVPDLGTDEKIDVVEILVAAGESVEVDDGLITLESDKASMDVPSPQAGVVEKIRVKAGDKIGEGDLILTMKAVAGSAEPEGAAAAPVAAALPAAKTRPAADRHAEVVVLGAGTGGYTAAFRAADLGKKVVLVDRDAVLGGVCLKVGCIPSKALLHVARVVDEAADLAERGVTFGKPKLDLDGLRGWKDSVVHRLTSGLATMAGKRGVEVVRGEARLSGLNEMTVAGDDGETKLSFDTAILAAGSRVARIGGVPWDDPRVMDSTGALELPEVPKRLLVVGGGIIGKQNNV